MNDVNYVWEVVDGPAWEDESSRAKLIADLAEHNRIIIEPYDVQLAIDDDGHPIPGKLQVKFQRI